MKNNNKNFKIPRLLHDMQKTIRKHSNELNTPINHYKRKYKRVPLWVLAEKLNFGTIAHFFNCLKTEDQNVIAHEIYTDYTEEYNYIRKSILNPTETSEILFFNVILEINVHMMREHFHIVINLLLEVLQILLSLKKKI